MNPNSPDLPGVFCNAKECKYNHENQKCAAPSIQVIGPQAQATPETHCETFLK